MPVPKLSLEKLLATAGVLRRAPLVSGVAREAMAILLEAATPDRHSLDRIEGEHGENVRQTARLVTSHTSRALRRAAEGLREISDAEWAELVEEAARDEDRFMGGL